MKFCIIGGGSCFAINLAKVLQANNHDVIGIGRSPRKPPCFNLGVDYPYWQYHITHELDYVMAVLNKEEPDIIVNFSAQGEGAASFNHGDYWRFYETNSMGLARLVGQIAMTRPYRGYCNRFIQIGTSELYGSVTQPSKETDGIVPTSPYAASKAAFDMHLMSISNVLKFPMNIVRPSNCYTPGQQLHRVIPKALLCAAIDKKLPLQGGGHAKKSFLHATDLSRAILKIATSAPLGEVYNVGSNEPNSIREIVRACSEVSGKPWGELVDEVGARVGEDSMYWLDSGKMKALGWKPEISLLEGITDVNEWIMRWRNELSQYDTTFRMKA